MTYHSFVAEIKRRPFNQFEINTFFSGYSYARLDKKGSTHSRHLPGMQSNHGDTVLKRFVQSLVLKGNPWQRIPSQHTKDGDKSVFNADKTSIDAADAESA